MTDRRNVNGSECKGIHCALSWNPDHSLIATIQEERGRTQVSFLEKNGLRHGEFVVDALENGKVAYNSAGDLLAVTVAWSSSCREETRRPSTPDCSPAVI